MASGPRRNISRASNKGYSGNMKGEGFVLGGLGIYDKEKGVVYEHAESEFGDHAPIEDILTAVKSLLGSS